MNVRFDLLEEGWIPCVPLAGGPPIHLSLRAVLTQAAEVREISHPSPLVTASMHRLLLAVLHCVFGPKSEEAWHGLWEQGAFDPAALDRYFAGERCCDRFSLFDEAHPFYQVPGLDWSYAVPVSVLAHALASGNNTTLFDHSSDLSPPALPAGEAALVLVAYQAYAVGGLVSSEKGQDRAKYGSATAAPLVKGAVALVRGETLFETLLLNLHRYSPKEEEPFSQSLDDRPAWEREEETRPEERQPLGYLDLLTWQSRRVRLQPELDHSGQLVVRRAVAMKGFQFPASFRRRGAETMVAFRSNEKATAGADPYPPVGFQLDRALWRDSLALMERADATPHGTKYTRPKTFDWLTELARDGFVDRAKVLPVDLLGLAADRAKVLLWRHERLLLPPAYLDEPKLRSEMNRGLEVAENVGWRVLRLSARELAIRLLAPKAGQDGGREPRREQIDPVVASLAVERLYWWRLEAPFKSFLDHLPAACAESADEDRPGARAIIAWREAVKLAAEAAFEMAAHGLDGSARALQAVGGVEPRFRGRLRRALDDYFKDETSTEDSVEDQVDQAALMEAPDLVPTEVP